MRWEARLLVVVGTALAVAAPAHAAPPSKLTCIHAFDRAQKARREGALLRSRDELLLCAQPECPEVVRADCANALRDVDAAQPTIVLEAADAKGADLTDVAVDLAGKPLTTRLDGRPIRVDPGKLVLTFKRPPWDPVELTILIAEGEKDRIVRPTLGPPLPPTPPPVVVPVTPPAPKRSPVGWAVPIALGVISTSAFVFAGVTRLSLGSDADGFRDSCAPRCPDSEIQPLHDRLTMVNVAIGVGIGTLAVAAITWLILTPKTPRPVGLR